MRYNPRRMIRYLDTRGLSDRPRTFTEAILEGIAPGGGLFVPERLPQLTIEEIVALVGAALSRARGARVRRPSASTSPPRARARSPPRPTATTSTTRPSPRCAKSLRGASCSSCGMARRSPSRTWRCSACRCSSARRSSRLTPAARPASTSSSSSRPRATPAWRRSTASPIAPTRGSACIYPDAGVSALQELQMVTQPGDNLTVFRLDGDFDACQSAVKAVFDDGAFAEELAGRHGLALSSANSINWGRLMPQIVYYVSAYADMVARGIVRRRRSTRRLRAHRQLRQHPRRVLRQAHGRAAGPPPVRQQRQQGAHAISSPRASTTSPRALSSRRPRRAWTSSSHPTSSACSTTCAATAPVVRRWMRDLRETGRFAVDGGTAGEAAGRGHRRVGRQRHLPAHHRPRAARARLPARPAYGRGVEASPRSSAAKTPRC